MVLFDGRLDGRETLKMEVGGWRWEAGLELDLSRRSLRLWRPGRSLVILCGRGWLRRAVVVEGERYSDLPSLLQLHAACNMYSSSCLSARGGSSAPPVETCRPRRK